jgi:hypothetical protein
MAMVAKRKITAPPGPSSPKPVTVLTEPPRLIISTSGLNSNSHHYSHKGEEPGFDSQHEQKIFLFTSASILALRPIQPPIQWVPGTPSLGVKWSRPEADHSLLSNAMVIS